MAPRLSWLGVLTVFLTAGGPTVWAQDSNDLPFFPVEPDPGPCPQVPIVKHFNVHRYLGRWYEIERFFAPFQTGDCVTADYELFPNNSVSVINTQDIDGEPDSAFGIANLGPNPDEGRLIVDFPFSSGQFSGPDLGGEPEPNYNILATDYDNYAVVYSCTYFGPEFKLEFSWILSRKPSLPSGFLNDLKAWLDVVNVNTARYSPLRQDNTCARRPMTY